MTRRQVLRAGGIGATVLAILAGAGAYVLAGDLVPALAVSVVVGIASLAGVLLGLRFGQWYEELMNRPWDKKPN